jgi:hypothetical protein
MVGVLVDRVFVPGLRHQIATINSRVIMITSATNVSLGVQRCFKLNGGWFMTVCLRVYNMRRARGPPL